MVAVSARISEDRITATASEPLATWRITIDEPRLDAIKSRADLVAFRRTARDVLERIGDTHGRKTPISIFMAAPNSIAVELGRARLEKAAPVWRLFDQSSPEAGFQHAFDIA